MFQFVRSSLFLIVFTIYTRIKIYLQLTYFIIAERLNLYNNYSIYVYRYFSDLHFHCPCLNLFNKKREKIQTLLLNLWCKLLGYYP